MTEPDFYYGCSEPYWLLVCLSTAFGKHWALPDRLIVLDLPAHNPRLSKRNSHAGRKKNHECMYSIKEIRIDFLYVPGMVMSL